MSKILHILLVFLLGLIIFSCAKEEEKKIVDTRPTVSSVNPTDNSTDVSVSTTVSVTFSETMSTSTITTNTDNTTCSGSFRLSSDNFTTCIKMSAVPTTSNSDKTFTVTPDDNLSGGTTYKIQITTSVSDTSSNSLTDNYTTSNGFTTYSSGTIKGTVKQSNGNALSDVLVSFSGANVDSTTTDNSGNFSKSLGLGSYTLTYGEAVDLKYCRPVFFHRHEGKFTVVLKDTKYPQNVSQDLNTNKIINVINPDTDAPTIPKVFFIPNLKFTESTALT